MGRLTRKKSKSSHPASAVDEVDAVVRVDVRSGRVAAKVDGHSDLVEKVDGLSDRVVRKVESVLDVRVGMMPEPDSRLELIGPGRCILPGLFFSFESQQEEYPDGEMACRFPDTC